MQTPRQAKKLSSVIPIFVFKHYFEVTEFYRGLLGFLKRILAFFSLTTKVVHVVVSVTAKNPKDNEAIQAAFDADRGTFKAIAHNYLRKYYTYPADLQPTLGKLPELIFDTIPMNSEIRKSFSKLSHFIILVDHLTHKRVFFKKVPVEQRKVITTASSTYSLEL